jgi:AcrR family transcriptional regulator
MPRLSIDLTAYKVTCQVYNEFVSEVKRRPYHSPVREQQAAATRASISEAAAVEFAERGWSGATLAAIADRAGVTPQAVHLAVGGKPALLIRAVETAVAGAGDAVPLAERPSFVDVYAPDTSARRRIAAFATASAAVYSNAARLFLVLRDAARADEAVAALAKDAARRRLSDHRRLVTLLCPDLTESAQARLTDTIWVLAGPGVYADLVHERQWSTQQYVDFLTGTLSDAIRRARREQRAAP